MNWLQKISALDFQKIRSIITNILDQADMSLPNEAQDAITRFVGHGPMSRNKNDFEAFGIMSSDSLENAFSPKPTPEGLVVRKQLESSFAHVKSQLQQILGDPIPLFRHQRPYTSDAPRNVLSWTLNEKYAQSSQGPDYSKYYAVIDRDGWYVKLCRNQEKAQQVANEINSAGGVTEEIQQKWNIEDNTIDLPVSIKPDPSENHSDFGEILNELTPLDRIVWATDRANQMEFIVKT